MKIILVAFGQESIVGGVGESRDHWLLFNHDSSDSVTVKENEKDRATEEIAAVALVIITRKISYW